MSSRRPIGFQGPYKAFNRTMQARFELAFDRTHSEKTALDLGVCADITRQNSDPQRAGQSRPRPDGVHPSLRLPRTGRFPGVLRATRSEEASCAIKWSWHLNALPRYGPAAAIAGMARKVIEHGRKRPGQAVKRQGIPLRSPYKRKAVLCLKGSFNVQLAQAQDHRQRGGQARQRCQARTRAGAVYPVS